MPSAKRKVVPQMGGLFGFFESKPADPNAPAVAPVPEAATPAAEGEKKGWLSGITGFFGKKEASAAPAAPAQSGGKKRAAAKKTTKSKTKAVKAKK